MEYFSFTQRFIFVIKFRFIRIYISESKNIIQQRLRFNDWRGQFVLKKYQKLSEVSNGRPGVLRSHLATDRYILMDRLSITWSNPGSHDYDNPDSLRGNNLSFRSRSWSSTSKISAIDSARRKHSLFVPHDTAIYLPHGYAISCPSLHYAGGILSCKQNGYEKTNTE